MIEEVVVTARKREERWINVPVSATVFGGDQLERYNTTTLQDLGDQAPNIEFFNVGSGSGGSLQIRGLGSTSSDAGIEQSVLVSIDGFPLSRGRVTKFSIFDVEAIEILKGPQALYFGKNSPAGVVAVRTADPTEEWQASFKGGHEFEADEYYGQAVVSGPLTETLGGRLAIRAETLDGWVDNVAQAQPNPFQPELALPGAADDERPGSKTLSGRLTLEYRPTDRLSAMLKVFGVHYRDKGEELTNARISCAPGFSTPTVFGVPDPSATCNIDDTLTKPAVPPTVGARWPQSNKGIPFSEINASISTLRVDYEFEDITATSVTGLLDLDSDAYDNADDTSYTQLSGANNEETQVFTQELRAVSSFDSPINFTVGAFFEDMQRDWVNAGRKVLNAPLNPDPRNGKLHGWEQDSRIEGQTVSAFAELSWALVDTLELTGGARYTRVEKEVLLQNVFVHSFYATLPIFLPEGEIVDATYEDQDVSPEVTLTWRPSPTWMVYGAFKTGYKAGGFSTPGVLSAGTTASSAEFASESALGGEIGTKFDVLGGRLTGSATVFRYAYDDLQVTAFDAATTSFLITNAAEMVTQGVEAELTWQATPAFRFRSAVGYNDAEFEQFTGAQCYNGQTAAEGCVGGFQDLSGKEPGGTSDWEAQLGLVYEHEMQQGWIVTGTTDVRWRSSYPGDNLNNPIGVQPSLTLVDASLRLTRRGSPWRAALIARNLTNQHYVRDASDTPGGLPGELNGNIQRTRQILLELGVDL